MPQELPPLPFGDLAEYKRARKGSGLSDEELLEEQAGVERRIAKKAALRGVTLIGAAVVKQRNASLRERAVSAASVSADASVSSAASAASVSSDASVSSAASLRERAAAVSSAASAASVSADASVSSATAVSSAASTASVSADASLRERAAAVSSAVSLAASVSSRGRPLRERKLWSEDDD